jgi:hypothetical protein
MADNDLEFSDNFRMPVPTDLEGEVRLACIGCGEIVFSSIDYGPGRTISLASLIDAAEDHEARTGQHQRSAQ